MVEVVYVLGGPGSGKTVHIKSIPEERGIGYGSVEDWLREETAPGVIIYGDDRTVTKAKRDPNWADKIRAQVHGDLEDEDDMLVELVVRKIPTLRTKMVLLDGFPRNVNQATKLSQLLGEPKGVIVLNASDDVLRRRMTGPPEVVSRRIGLFRGATTEMIRQYRLWADKGGAKVITVEAAPPLEVVRLDFLAAVGKIWAPPGENKLCALA